MLSKDAEQKSRRNLGLASYLPKCYKKTEREGCQSVTKRGKGAKVLQKDREGRVPKCYKKREGCQSVTKRQRGKGAKVLQKEGRVPKCYKKTEREGRDVHGVVADCFR
jgi:putative hemolysin